MNLYNTCTIPSRDGNLWLNQQGKEGCVRGGWFGAGSSSLSVCSWVKEFSLTVGNITRLLPLHGMVDVSFGERKKNPQGRKIHREEKSTGIQHFSSSLQSLHQVVPAYIYRAFTSWYDCLCCTLVLT